MKKETAEMIGVLPFIIILVILSVILLGLIVYGSVFGTGINRIFSLILLGTILLSCWVYSWVKYSYKLKGTYRLI